MEQGYKVTDNKEQLQFQVILPDDVAFIEYRWYDGKLALMHTVVPEKYEGKGIASTLARYVLDYAKENGISILPYCPYIAAYLKRHPEYNDIVSPI